MQTDLPILTNLLKKTSLSSAEQKAIIKKIETQGYLDEQTRLDLIDILANANTILTSLEDSLSAKNTKQLVNDMSEMQAEKEAIMAMDEAALKNV